MKIKKTPAEIFAEYEKGQAYNRSITLYDTVNKNEEFMMGDQWKGMEAPDLEKPVFNFLHRVTTYLISMIVSDDIGVSIGGFSNTPEMERLTKILSSEVDRVIERAKAKAKSRDLLRDAAVDGDGCFYLYFDPAVRTGQLAQGEIEIENAENTKVIFGNPYLCDVQKQPYILVVKREMLEDVREEAEKNGVDPQLIQPDEDGQTFYGEEHGEEAQLVTVIMKFYKENGSVRFLKSTRETLLRDENDTGYRLYPIAWYSWEKIKNSYHGRAVITGLIPNQIYVNKLMAMAAEQQKKMAFPKVIYNMNKFPDGWDNKVGQAIGVAGDPNEAIASGFRAPEMSNQVFQMVDMTVNLTKDFMGASDAALGNVKPDNTSAIIAVQKASSAPLELQRMAFYQFVEDYIRILIDMMREDYGARVCSFTNALGEKEQAAVDFSQLPIDGMELNIEVGSSAYFSELMQMTTNDNLFQKKIIDDPILYLEGIPDKFIRNKSKIMDSLKERKQMQEQMAAQAIRPDATPPGGGGEQMPQM